MSIASEITRLQTAKASIKTAIESKGVTVPASTTLSGYGTLINGIVLATPIEVSTDAGMTEVLVSGNVGKAYRFTGTTGTYTNGDIYIVESSE